MSQTPKLGTAAIPGIPVPGSIVGITPPAPLTGTTVQDAIDELQAEIDALTPPAGDNLTKNNGEGGAFVQTIAASGASQTLDLSLYNTFDITLTANCTLTFSFSLTPPSGDAHWTIILRQGGTGSYTVTWPAAVDWQDPATGGTGASAPTLWTAVGSQNSIEITTLDAGLSYGGSMGGGGSALTVKDEGTPLATAATSLDFVGAGVVASGATAAKTITISGVPTGSAGGDLSGTYPNPTVNASAIAALLPPPHVHVNNVTFSGDSSTTVFTLPVAPVDAYSIGVYVGTGRNNDWTLSGALLDILTFGSAPTTGTDNISIDIAAASL